jgi:two-component system phosphate regulon sensor histidine kinase PhoR
VLKQAQRLNRLVEDLMTISKIELGEIKFHFEEVVLNDALAGVLPLMEPKAKLKNISLNNLVSAELAPVQADRDRLSQIFVNILDNAVKFTPENGAIDISAKEDEGFAIVKVIDSGIGIPRDEIERLGERFYRVDKTRSRELGGTGLGLSIVKHLMMAHGGKMEIESRLGYGTTLSLFFPLTKN